MGAMNIEINPRGKGACPLCKRNGTCAVQNNLIKAVDGYATEGDPLVIVVYGCPQFREGL